MSPQHRTSITRAPLPAESTEANRSPATLIDPNVCSFTTGFNPREVCGAQQEGHRVVSLLTLQVAGPAWPSHPGATPGWATGTPNSS